METPKPHSWQQFQVNIELIKSLDEIGTEEPKVKA